MLRIGVIGAGGRGILAKRWHRPEDGESIIVGAADPNPASLDLVRDYTGGEAFLTSDYRELLAQPDLDAVGVFSPDYLHEEHAVAVLESGRHLFLEKPIAITTEGCDRILDAWRRSGVKFMVGFNMRYMPVFNRVKTLLDEGEIGVLKSIWVRHFVGAGSDFYFHDWHAQQKHCNSLLLQKGSHDIDMIHWLAGAYTRETAAFGSLDYFGGQYPATQSCLDCRDRGVCPDVQAEDNPRQQCAFRNTVDIEDNHVVILRLENGIQAAYLQCHFAPEYLRNYTLIGSRGRIEANVERNEVWLYRRKNSRTWESDPVKPEACHPDAGSADHGGADPRIAQGFLDMILRDIEPVSHPLAGRMSVAAACAAVRSVREGGMHTVTPSANTVIPALELTR